MYESNDVLQYIYDTVDDFMQVELQLLLIHVSIRMAKMHDSRKGNEREQE